MLVDHSKVISIALLTLVESIESLKFTIKLKYHYTKYQKKRKERYVSNYGGKKLTARSSNFLSRLVDSNLSLKWRILDIDWFSLYGRLLGNKVRETMKQLEETQLGARAPSSRNLRARLLLLGNKIRAGRWWNQADTGCLRPSRVNIALVLSSKMSPWEDFKAGALHSKLAGEATDAGQVLGPQYGAWLAML